jgi:DNA adenine methylase
MGDPTPAGKVKPPILYFGGKITLGQTIARLLPEHTHYVEPFCGSLAVLLAKTPSPHETVNDLDQDLMTFWQVLRDQPDDLERACALTPHSRGEFDQARDLDGVSDLERARRVWVLLTQGRAARLMRTGWRHYVDPAGSSHGMPDYLAGYVDRIGPAARRLQGVSLECRPALEVIGKYGASPDVCLYVDPPYLGSTRANDNAYRHELRSEDEHRELAAALHAARAAVVLSGYPSDLYDLDLYGDWHRHTFAASTGQGGTWANRTEVLWSNRPIGDAHLFSAAAFDLGGAVS